MSKPRSDQLFVPLAFHDFYKTNGLNRDVFTTYTEGPSMTRQEFADECDVNQLMARYEAAGATINGLPRDMNAVAQYVDFSEMPQTLMDYMEYMDKAQAAFMTLPALVRREFDNNAHMFVDFAMDPTNIGQLRQWGLAEPEKPKDAPKAPEPGASSEPPKAP